ncbi:hypothetical protein ABEI05_17565 [Erwinia billingiae]|uniref:hypothetical protein n=1 Tax=Erwinia billingiae TaxID=182337 RepID=UPI00320A1CC0
MANIRDEFSERVKKILQERVANRCSNPNCNCLTSGPNYDEEKATRIGVAAHITAAAQNGPRFNPFISTEERKHISNGIWLCQNCAKLIDSDEKIYTELVIRGWKSLTESEIRQELEGGLLGNQGPKISGWCCGHCNSFVAQGQMVCIGCQAEVAYGATKHEVANARIQGGILGALCGGVINFGMPSFLNSHFNFSIPDGWGLGIYSLYFIAVPALLGVVLFERFEKNKFHNKPPRFFRERNI